MVRDISTAPSLPAVTSGGLGFISLQPGKPGLISAAEKDTSFRRSSSAASALQPTQFALQGPKKLKVRRLP